MPHGRRIRGAAAAGGGAVGEGTPSLTGVETIDAPAPQLYTPSPMDASLIAPQLFALVFILGVAAYLQVFVTGTARARFDKADPRRRAFVESATGDRRGESAPGWVERELARKGGTRPRGDRTEGGRVIPGLGDAPEWMRRGEDDELDS